MKINSLFNTFKRITNHHYYLLIILMITFSCKHEPEPRPFKTTTKPPVTGSTNIKDSVCFDNEIQPLLTSRCANSGCHDDATRESGINLSSYSSLKSTASGNLIMQAIQDSGPLGMPLAPNPKLTSAEIQLLQKWINEGMKDGIDCISPCDTINVTFSGMINPLIQNTCLGCHTGPGTMLTDYNNIKALVDNGKLHCAVNHLNGCEPMPQNAPKLSDCKLKQIQKWIDAGAPNN